MSVAFSAFVWSGHSCPLPLVLILVLVLILTLKLLLIATDSSQPGPNQKTTLTSKAADKSVRPTPSFNLTYPEPPIVLGTNRQPCPHRILPDILEFLPETFVRPQHMIQRLILPNWSGAAKQSIYAPSRNSLDQLQD